MNIWQRLTDFNVSNNEELGNEVLKKYKNTYLFLEQNERKIPVYLRSYEDGYYYVLDENDVYIKLNTNTKTELFNFKPIKCLFNHEKHCLYIYKNPARQFKRGVCQENTSISDPILNLNSRANGLIKIEHKYLQSLINENYYSFDILHDKIKTKNVYSGALDKNFMISLSITNDPSLLFVWYHTTLIGYINNNKLYCKNPYFAQEVYDNRHLFKPLELEF